MSYYVQIQQQQEAKTQEHAVQLRASGHKTLAANIVHVNAEQLHALRQKIQHMHSQPEQPSDGGPTVEQDEVPFPSLPALLQREQYLSVEHSALVYGHGRQVGPEAFLNVCYDTFPYPPPQQTEQWLLLRNSTFPYSALTVEERNALKGIEPLVLSLLVVNVVATLYLVLRRKKKGGEEKRESADSTEVYFVFGDFVADNGILVKDQGQAYFGATELARAVVVRPGEVELSVQQEKPKDAPYKVIYAVRAPASKSDMSGISDISDPWALPNMPDRCEYFAGHTAYVEPAALPLLLRNLAEATTPVETAQVAHMLGMLGPAAAVAVPELVKRIAAAKGDDACSLIDVLGDIGGPDAVAALRKHAATVGTPLAQNILLLALLRIGSAPALEVVFDHFACFRPDLVVRWLAARQLTELLLARMLRGAAHCAPAGWQGDAPRSAGSLFTANARNSSARFVVDFLREDVEQTRFAPVLADQLRSTEATADKSLVVLLLQVIAALGIPYWRRYDGRIELAASLSPFLSDADPQVATSAAQAIVNLVRPGSDGTLAQWLAPGLEHPDAGVKRELVQLLRAAGEGDVWAALGQTPEVQPNRLPAVQPRYHATESPRTRRRHFPSIVRLLLGVAEGLLVIVLLFGAFFLLAAAAYAALTTGTTVGAVALCLSLVLLMATAFMLINGLFIVSSAFGMDIQDRPRVRQGFYIPALVVALAAVLLYVLLV